MNANSCSDPRPDPGGEGGLALLSKDEPEAGAVLQGCCGGGAPIHTKVLLDVLAGLGPVTN